MRPLDRAVDDLAAVDPATLDDRTLAEALIELRRVRARLAAVEARLVDAVDTRRPWAPAGYRTTACWLADGDNTALGDARGQVRLARRLRTMPATAAALAAGDITAAHAHRLASLNTAATASVFGDAEEFLVGQARTLRWADFTRACAYRARAARDDQPDADKTTAHLARTPRQRRHDALVEMALRASAAPPDARRPRPLLTILAGYHAFKDICELGDGSLVSPATVAQLLDDAVIERIVFDGPSRVLDLGQARKRIRDRCLHDPHWAT